MSNKSKKSQGSGSSTKEEITIDPNLREIKSLTLWSTDNSITLKKLNITLLINYIKELSLGKPVEPEGSITVSLFGKPCVFKVVDFQVKEEELKEEKEPSEEKKFKFVVTKQTSITIADVDKKSAKAEEKQDKDSIIKIANNGQTENNIIIAGLDKEIKQLSNLVDRIQNKPLSESLVDDFLAVKKGVLLYGPSGVGKTTLLKYVSNNYSEVKFMVINTRELLVKASGEIDKKLADIFQEARQYRPCVLFFDDIHLICDKKEIGRESSQAVLNSFLNEIDSITLKEQLLVVISTSQITSIDNALRRAGRFDKEIKIEVPSLSNRIEILKKYLAKIPHSLQDEDIKDIADSTNGFTGADIMVLLREALIKGVKLDEEKNSDIKLLKKNIDEAIEEVNPSGLKDLILEIPKVLWSDIGGYADIKDEIKQVIEWPLKHPEAFIRMGIKPSRGILLYGPPGCSKTMIAKAIATESKLNFIAVKGPEIFSKYVGDSEKAVRDLFKRARLCSPSIIFFDEIDAIASQRSSTTEVSDRVLIQLLNEMDGIDTLKHVIVVGATNRPDSLDLALLRPGRFDRLIYIHLPDLDCRREILKLNIIGNKMPLEDEANIEQGIEELAKLTEGYTGAEICMICREAGMCALTRDLKEGKIKKEDFAMALKKILPRITKDSLSYYDNFYKNTKMI